MQLNEFYNVLKGVGIPVTYHAFPADACPNMPFLTYDETGSNNFSADGKVFFHGKQIQVTLFTKKKDIVTENKLVEALDRASIYWENTFEYDENESCYISVYEMEI